MDNPFAIRGHITFLPCHDLAATADFYGRDLRLTLARDQGTCLIYRVATRAYLGFCQHEGPLPQHQGLILTLLIDDVDGAYRRLRSLGIETEDKPKRNEVYGIYHFFARDPSGYRLEIQRFFEPLA
jgi:catechol 2,3-dioxygenase-like lactoylglutathione lyase family enzyme